MSAVDKNFVLSVLRKMFTDVVSASLCESAGETIIFVLGNRLGGDPFEVFWERPKAVYDGLRGIFGDGTDVLIKLWVKAFRQKAEANVNPERFVHFLQRNDPESVKEIRKMLIELVTAYHKACGKSEEKG
ncbi:MAG: hypothetical protein QXH20_06815 [Candidatus Bathyarchaeia archaeon]